MGEPSIQVLGPTLVGHGDTSQPLTGQLATLTCVLTSRFPESASRTSIAEAIWNDEIPKSASTAVRVLAHRLRQLLGSSESVINEHDGYRLNIAAEAIDSVRFTTGVAHARDLVGTGRLQDGIELLQAALVEWRGVAYAGLGDPILRPAAVALGQLRCDAEELLLDALLRSSRADEAAALGSTLIEQEPYRERRWELHMLALYRTGRQREALDAAATVTRLLRTDLGIEPGPRLRRLESDILDQRDDLILSTPAHRVDEPDDGIVGRGVELDRLMALVDSDPVVTIVGPGGIGKTAVAAALAKRVGRESAASVHWCDLSHATATDLVSRVADSLDISTGPRTGAELAEAVAARPSTLLFIDNADHHTDALAPLLQDLLQHQHMRFVCSSRVRLRIAAEVMFELGPLDPAGPAVELFEEILTRVRPDRAEEPTESDERDTMLAICRQLDGVPLAIELAAARTRVMSLDEIRSDIGRVLDRPSPTRAASDRHTTMTSAINWSTGLLSADAQRALSRLAVFAGSFDMEAAGAIVGGDADVLAAIEELVDHSLVQVLAGTRRTRYRMLAPIRHHAHEQLRTDPDQRAAARDRHLEHFTRQVEAAFETFTTTSDHDLIAIIDHDLDNLAEAHARAVETKRWSDDARLYRPLLVSQLFDLVTPFRWASESVAARGSSDTEFEDELVPMLFAAWYDALAVRLDLAAASALLARLDRHRDTPDRDLCELASGLHHLLVLHDYDAARTILDSIESADPYVTYARRSVSASIPVHRARRTGLDSSADQARTAAATLRDDVEWAESIGARSLATGLLEQVAQHLAGVAPAAEALAIANQAQGQARELGMTFVESQASYQQVRVSIIAGDHSDPVASRMADVLASGVRTFSGARLRWQLGAAAELLACRDQPAAADRCMLHAGFADVPLKTVTLRDEADRAAALARSQGATIFEVAAEAASALRLTDT